MKNLKIIIISLLFWCCTFTIYATKGYEISFDQNIFPRNIYEESGARLEYNKLSNSTYASITNDANKIRVINISNNDISNDILSSYDIQNKQVLSIVSEVLKKIHKKKKFKEHQIGELYFQEIYNSLEFLRNVRSKEIIELKSGVTKLEKIRKLMPKQDVLVLSNNNFQAKNIILRNDMAWLIDWSSADWSDIYNDFASLVVHDNLSNVQKEYLLQSYFNDVNEEKIYLLDYSCALYSLKLSIQYYLKYSKSKSTDYIQKYQNIHYASHYLGKFYKFLKILEDRNHIIVN